MKWRYLDPIRRTDSSFHPNYTSRVRLARVPRQLRAQNLQEFAFVFDDISDERHIVSPNGCRTEIRQFSTTFQRSFKMDFQEGGLISRVEVEYTLATWLFHPCK